MSFTHAVGTAQVASGGYGNASIFHRPVVRIDQKALFSGFSDAGKGTAHVVNRYGCNENAPIHDKESAFSLRIAVTGW
jgi:hypothetical protein